MRPAQRRTDSVLPLDSARYRRPHLQAHPCGLDGLPDVDIGMTHNQRVFTARPAADGIGDPRLLGPGHQMIDQHAEASARSRSEVGDDTRQIVDTTEILDHHTLGPQIVTPNLFDEFGIVAAFDINPTGQCNPGTGVGNLH